MQSQLLSLALYENEKSSFYVEVLDYDEGVINRWVQENVISKFRLNHSKSNSISKRYENALPYREVREKLTVWLDSNYSNTKLTICSDNYTWDWLHLCEIYGGAMALPHNIHYIPLDLATILYTNKMDVDLSRIELAKKISGKEDLSNHNAMDDAVAISIIFNDLCL